MRKLLIAAILLSATAAHAGPDLAVARTEVQQTAVSSSMELQDTSLLAAKRQTVMQQKMAIQKQKQMVMQREMQLHPIRTRLHFALLKLKQKFYRAY